MVMANDLDKSDTLVRAERGGGGGHRGSSTNEENNEWAVAALAAGRVQGFACQVSGCRQR